MPRTPERRFSRTDIVTIFGLIVLTVTAFWRTIPFYFLSDDLVLLKHARSLHGAFRPLFSTGGGDGFFRLTDDAAGVLDAYQIEHAHLIGMSLGGMIAQLTALKHPARVATVTLIASSVFGPNNPDLPPIDEKILAYHRSGAELNWSDEAAVIDYMVGGWRLLSGAAYPFDEPAIRAIATGEVKRARNLLSMFNHALLAGGESWHGKIGEIRVPALVIHGTDDPVLPYPHGLALARAIPGAKLLTLNGTGHELHAADWNTIVDSILKHTALN